MVELHDSLLPWYTGCTTCAVIWQVMLAIVVLVHKTDDVWLVGPMEKALGKQNAVHNNIMESW